MCDPWMTSCLLPLLLALPRKSIIASSSVSIIAVFSHGFYRCFHIPFFASTTASTLICILAFDFTLVFLNLFLLQFPLPLLFLLPLKFPSFLFLFASPYASNSVSIIALASILVSCVHYRFCFHFSVHYFFPFHSWVYHFFRFLLQSALPFLIPFCC